MKNQNYFNSFECHTEITELRSTAVGKVKAQIFLSPAEMKEIKEIKNFAEEMKSQKLISSMMLLFFLYFLYFCGTLL